MLVNSTDGICKGGRHFTLRIFVFTENLQVALEEGDRDSKG